MKKPLLIILVGTFYFLNAVTIPANSTTIKNGVVCTKANALTKVGGKTYKCAKNPYVSPTKRTWTLTGCLTAYSLWKNAKEEYDNWKDLAKLAGPEGEKNMNDLLESISSLETTMKTVACKKGA